MEQKIDLSKGINKDITPVKQPPGSYVDALNVEIINDELQGSLAISNSKGNKFQITLPSVTKITKITIKNFSGGSSDLEIDGEIYGTPFTTTESSTGLDLYKYIKDNYTGYGTVYNVYYSSFYVVIVPIDLSYNVNVDSSDHSILDISLQTNATFGKINPIGYSILRDDIYIFAANSNIPKPELSDYAFGYIFKVTYDNITFDSTSANITLIYAANLQFSQFNPIFPTGNVTRYENNGIERIYWTDNYNKTRSINVKDPQLFALDPKLLDLIPTVHFDIPLLTNISAAPGTEEVHPGCWQIAYRLKKQNGAITAFSPLSDRVNIVPTDERLVMNPSVESNWILYHGAPQGVGFTKQVTWTVNNVDVSFDSIEFCLARRSDKNDAGTFYLIDEIDIGINTSISVTVNGTKLSTALTLTLDEFILTSSTFTHCKTMSTKDNRLVVGNIRNEIGSIDYDARAYRWSDDLTHFDLINNGNITSYTDPNDVKLDDDAICPFNLDPFGGGDYNSTMKYNPDSGFLGGKGKNISYEFVSIATAADRYDNLTCGVPYFKTVIDDIGQYISLGVNSINKEDNDVLQEHTKYFETNREIDSGIKFPPFSTLLTGYQNNETYRMGVQFYDTTKQPYFVEWIGDIKFPSIGETCNPDNNIFTDGTPTGQTTFEKTIIVSSGNNNAVFTTQLGIKFNITIPEELTDKIGGYSIVRVKREEKDKNVKSEGIIRHMWYISGISDVGYYTQYYRPPDTGSASPIYSKMMYYSPNILDGTLDTPSTGDRLITTTLSKLTDSSDYSLYDKGCAGFVEDGSFRTWVLKTWLDTESYTTSSLINASVFCAGSVRFTDPLGTDDINNYDARNDRGNSNYYLSTESNIFNSDSNNKGLYCYIFNYKNEQYGGNTFLHRSKNVYLRCSNYRPIIQKSTNVVDDIICYGGDVYNGIMDDVVLAGNLEPPPTSYTICVAYPASSPVNMELRSGNHFNKDATERVGLSWNYVDEYEYNTAYSCEDDIFSFFPKPSNYQNNNVYDNRFYISEIKTNGEASDSWLDFKTNNYWDVEGTYGPINSMLPLIDKMYFWQDRAFGIIEINPRAVVTDINNVTNTQLQLGTGLPLQRHDYLTVTAGSKHQGSTIASYGKLYWYDANTFKLWRYAAGDSINPLSDLKGIYSYLSKYLAGNIQNYDKPLVKLSDVIGYSGGINGVVATYDNTHQKVIYTFHSSINDAQTSFTISLNELTDFFTTYYSFIPRMYVNDGKNVFSFDNNNEDKLNDLYIHNKGDYNNFYGIIYDSYIKFISNPNPDVIKVFDNIYLDTQATKYVPATDFYQNYNNITVNRLRVTNDYQNTGIQTLTYDSNIKRKERTWKLAIPRNRVLYTSSNSPNIYTDLSSVNKTFGERIRDKYAQVEFWFKSNVDNYQLKINNIIMSFRESSR